MFGQDNTSQADPVTAETQPDVISQWKTEVQHFFSNEWGNLRDLIRRLEESDWDGIALEQPEGPAPRPFHSTIGEEIAAAHRASAATTVKTNSNTDTAPMPKISQPVLMPTQLEIPSAPRPAATENTRLADLAKRLESQLKRTTPDA